MCGCKTHHFPSAECTCRCPHPNDGRYTRFMKRLSIRSEMLGYEAAKRVEKIQIAIVQRVPRWLAYRCFIRVAMNASREMPNREVPGITITEAAKLWDKR